MLIKWANKKIQQKRPFQGGLLIKMHSRLTKSYNINGMDHLNVVFGSYRTIKQVLLKLLQLPAVNVQDDCIRICNWVSSMVLAPLLVIWLFIFVHAVLLLRCSLNPGLAGDALRAWGCALPFLWAMSVHAGPRVSRDWCWGIVLPQWAKWLIWNLSVMLF